jgi:hypothetical protein
MAMKITLFFSQSTFPRIPLIHSILGMAAHVPKAASVHTDCGYCRNHLFKAVAGWKT